MQIMGSYVALCKINTRTEYLIVEKKQQTPRISMAKKKEKPN